MNVFLINYMAVHNRKVVTANTSVEGTAQKLRFWVPSLRSAAPHLGRWAAQMPHSRAASHESKARDHRATMMNLLITASYEASRH